MSILWCGGEDVDFKRGLASPVVGTTSTNFRSDFARCCLYGANFFIGNAFPGGEVTSVWVSARIKVNISYDNPHLFGITNVSGYGIWVKKNSSAIEIYNRTSAGWGSVLAASSSGVLTGSVEKIDINLQNYGSSATINVYREGVLAVTYSGDISISGVTGFDCVSIYGDDMSQDRGSISEVIVADEDTRLMSLKTLAPDAAGDATEWDGAYTDIDEVTLSDADTIYTDTADEDFQCNLTDMPAGDYIVKAVKVAARCTDGGGGIGIKIGIKTNSTVDLGDTTELGGYWETHEEIYSENPVTSNRFTPSEIDDLQIAFQSVEIV